MGSGPATCCARFSGLSPRRTPPKYHFCRSSGSWQPPGHLFCRSSGFWKPPDYYFCRSNASRKPPDYYSCRSNASRRPPDYYFCRSSVSWEPPDYYFVDPTPPGNLQNTIFVNPEPPGGFTQRKAGKSKRMKIPSMSLAVSLLRACAYVAGTIRMAIARLLALSFSPCGDGVPLNRKDVDFTATVGLRFLGRHRTET